MNRKDTDRLALILRQANDLMDSAPSVNPVVSNADVVEALIGDIQLVKGGRDPKELARLIELENEECQKKRN